MKFLSVVSLAILTTMTVSAEAAKIRVPEDYLTIQEAIDNAAANDTVEVSEGTYPENLSIAARNNLTVKAKSGDKVIVDAGGAGVVLTISALSDEITVKNLQLQNTTAQGIQIGFATNITISGCTVKNVDSEGIQVGISWPVKIKSCTVKNVGGDGISLLAAGAFLNKNTITNAGDNGILVVGDTNTIQQNVIENPAGDGIQLGDTGQACYSCLVLDNEISDPGGEGILLTDEADYCSILENTVDGAAFDGIDAFPGSDGHVILDNVIKNGLFEGIEVDSDGCIVRGNKVKKPTGDGIAIQGNCDNGLIFGNKVKKAGADGVDVTGAGNVFINNQASKSAEYDLNDHSNPGDNAFLDNTFSTIAP